MRARELCAIEVMQAHLDRIERVNPAVNAMVTFRRSAASTGARAVDAALARGESLGPLAGLPVAHKDLVPTRGVRTTSGSLIFKDFVPDTDAILVERLRAAGAIMIGKTNMPEFGVGSQNVNAVFGATRNPYDLEKPAAGAAAARPRRWPRLLPIADDPISAEACAIRRASATWWDAGHLPAAFRTGRGSRPGSIWRCSARWLAPYKTPRSCSRRWPAPMRAIRCPCRSRARFSLDRLPGILRAHASLGARCWCFRRARSASHRRCAATSLSGSRLHRRGGYAGLARRRGDLSRAARLHVHFTLGPLLESHRELMKDTVVWNIEQGARLSGSADRRDGNETHAAFSSHAGIHAALRFSGGARDPGAAVRCRRALPDTHRRCRARDLPRLDALVLPHQRDRGAGYLRALRLLGLGTSRGPADRRCSPARPRRAAVRDGQLEQATQVHRHRPPATDRPRSTRLTPPASATATSPRPAD